MTITTTKTIEEQVKITPPIFWREPKLSEGAAASIIGVLDENTVVYIYTTDRYTSITNSEMWIRESDVTRAYNRWEQITEEEFFAAYQKAYESLNLNPIVKDGAFAD